LLPDISPTRRNWLLALLGLSLAYFAWQIRAVLNPLIAAYFFAFVLHPLVLRLQRHGWSRKRAVNTIFVSAALLWCGVTFGIGLQATNSGGARFADEAR
jgi:predicted PurR-regulated permease PerM